MTAVISDTQNNLILRSWRDHGLALAALVLLILVSFRESVSDAVSVWWIYPTYSHCFLILPISFWLAWEKRERLAHIAPSVELRALWAVPVLVLMWWLGRLATINEVQQFAVVGLIQVAIVAMLGMRVCRLVWFPTLYLLFLVPTGQYLIGPMQRLATVFVDSMLNLINIPHYTEGTLIELSNGRFEIAEACAGLRFLIATVALGVLFAYLTFRKWYKVVLFLASCVAVPLIGNGLRIVGIILLAHFTSNEYGVGADHLVYGWGFNIAILLVLFLCGSRFRDPISERSDHADIAPPPDSSQKLIVALVSAAVLSAAGPAFAMWHESERLGTSAAEIGRPLNLRGWHATQNYSDWKPNYLDMDAHLAASFSSDSSPASPPVDFFIGYYATERSGHALTAHISHLWEGDLWTPIASGTVRARLEGQDISLQETVITSVAERRMIWTSYWIDGKFTTSTLTVRLRQIRAGLEGHEGEALVAISTIVDDTDDAARRRLTEALQATPDLSGRLTRASGRSSAASGAN